jgi:hypothetical protein
MYRALPWQIASRASLIVHPSSAARPRQ